MPFSLNSNTIEIIKDKVAQESLLTAMEEAMHISHDPNIPSYSTMEELKKALEE